MLVRTRKFAGCRLSRSVHRLPVDGELHAPVPSCTPPTTSPAERSAEKQQAHPNMRRSAALVQRRTAANYILDADVIIGGPGGQGRT